MTNKASDSLTRIFENKSQIDILFIYFYEIIIKTTYLQSVLNTHVLQQKLLKTITKKHSNIVVLY